MSTISTKAKEKIEKDFAARMLTSSYKNGGYGFGVSNAGSYIFRKVVCPAMFWAALVSIVLYIYRELFYVCS